MFFVFILYVPILWITPVDLMGLLGFQRMFEDFLRDLGGSCTEGVVNL